MTDTEDRTEEIQDSAHEGQTSEETVAVAKVEEEVILLEADVPVHALRAALEQVAPVARGARHIPSCNDVLLYAPNPFALTISGTNLETYIETTIGGLMTPGDGVTVEAKAMVEAIKETYADDRARIKAVKTGKQVLVDVVADTNRIRFSKAQTAGNFPPMPESIGECEAFSIPAPTFTSAIKYVAPMAATNDDSRPVLQTIRAMFRNGSMNLGGADGTKLGIVDTGAEGDGDVEVLIVARSLSHVQRVSANMDGNSHVGISLVRSEEQGRFTLVRFDFNTSVGTCKVWSRLELSGQYPDLFATAEPDGEVSATVTVEGKDLAQFTAVANKFSMQDGDRDLAIVKLYIEDNAEHVYAKDEKGEVLTDENGDEVIREIVRDPALVVHADQENGWARWTIPCSYEGDPDTRMGFGSKVLMEGVKGFSNCDRVRLTFAGRSKASTYPRLLVNSNQADDERTAVVMPRNINW